MSQELIRFRNHCRQMMGAPEVAPNDRALFARLAREIEAYLDGSTSVDLFGELTPEPAPEGDRR